MIAEQQRLVALTPTWSLWPVAAVRSAGMPFELLSRFAVPELLTTPPSEDRNAEIRRSAAEAVAATVQDEVLREALVWQNPEVIDTWLGDYATRLAAGGRARLSNRAYREGVIARYAQRYCAKNDSIGFFGPVAWARFAPSERGLRQSGDGGIRRRTVNLETWAIAALADAWRQDERLFPHLPVRLDPATSVVDGMLWRPRRSPVECSGVTARLLAAIDGRRRCGDVLAAAGATGTTYTADELRAELSRLHDLGMVQIGFRVPHHHRPEAYLRRQVEQIPDSQTRTDLLQRLDQIVAARDVVQRSRRPEPVRAALSELSRQFVKAGASEAARSRRVAYARTAAYLDCRRDTDVRIGGDLLDALRTPLGVLLDSARWLSNEIAAAVADGMVERYRRLRSRRDAVTLSDLQFAASDLLSPTGPVATTVLADFQLRWAEILPRGSTGEVRLTGAVVQPLASALFPVGEQRWAAARQHSPDLLLSRSADGATRWVLGELHVALNTLESRVFSTQCDNPDELVALTKADMHGGRVVPLYPLDAAEATARTYPPLALDPPGHYRYWSYASDEGHPDGTPSVAGTDVLVHERDGELIGAPRRHGWTAPVLEFFGEFLTATVVNLFQIRERQAHLGRVLLDDVVVCRESWSLPVTGTPVPAPGRRIADRGYQTVRDWAAQLGMPRHVFVRTPFERKPFYVDFCAPLLVGNLVRSLRRAAAEPEQPVGPAMVDIVEMLPRPEDLWLGDSLGRFYTAEFRVVAVNSSE